MNHGKAILSIYDSVAISVGDNTEWVAICNVSCWIINNNNMDIHIAAHLCTTFKMLKYIYMKINYF